MTDDVKVFEGWAILELMGHRRLAGHVSEVEIAGQGFLRLEIPEVVDDDDTYPAVTQFYSPSSVYALTPTTEETARGVRSRPAPVNAYEVARLPALPVGAPVGASHDPDDGEDGRRAP